MRKRANGYGKKVLVLWEKSQETHVRHRPPGIKPQDTTNQPNISCFKVVKTRNGLVMDQVVCPTSHSSEWSHFPKEIWSHDESFEVCQSRLWFCTPMVFGVILHCIYFHLWCKIYGRESIVKCAVKWKLPLEWYSPLCSLGLDVGFVLWEFLFWFS